MKMKKMAKSAFATTLLMLVVWFSTCHGKLLPRNEVNALREIAKELGKNDWNFSVDPCSKHPSWFSQSIPARPSYVNQITCNCDGSVCHVYNISLKGQDLAGVLPKSLVNLPNLTVIDLTRNYLTGAIPREWASMNLTYLSVIVNRLSGPIPAYLGDFKTLTYISLESNQFYGTVPAELGKLVNLQNLILSANNLTGQLPKELMNLAKLTELRLSSNNFSGTMPNYFHSWRNLQKLEIMGSGFEGPIPISISGLTNSTELRISDLTGTGSTFPSLISMGKMSKLVLRNCGLSGSIPTSIADDMPSLKILDLSFNMLEGPLPDNLARLNKLENLYLSSNFLSGNVPDWIKGRSIGIDLSYNNFNVSSVPTSCKAENVNYFRSSSRNRSLQLVECQEGFPCSKTKYSLHINCGGKQAVLGKTTYEADDDHGGPAKFFPTKAEWGLSSSGQFWNLDGSTYGTYLASNTSILAMTDSALYTNARLGATSLTYYGRCLGTGNYSVTMNFAELIFTDNDSFLSLGVRMFDVYIQEKLVLKDFDVRKKANGSNKAVNITFQHVSVKDTIHIRFYYAGKGTTAVPVRGIYGPLVSAISVESEFTPPVDGKKIAKIAGGVVAAFVAVVFVVIIITWRRLRSDNKINREMVLKGLDLKTGSFTFRQLRAATDNFDPDNKIGEGGFGSVFKGTLLDGSYIAVKHLLARSSQANRQFVNEIGIISGLNHPNLVRFYGCCAEGNELLLVYEYMVNNHLGHALFEGPDDGRLKLDWATRRKIAISIARGLAFLHEESPIKIVHRDIKVANILLDGELNAKIADFGLARLDEEDKTHISTRIAGTIGYMAPEYVLWGYLTFKADVYSFGVVLLEIVAGRCNMKFRPDENHFCLLDWAMWLRQKGDLMDLVDPRLASDYNKEEALRMIKIALLCTDPSPALRPSMSSVVSMLEGDLAVHAATGEEATAYTASEWMVQASRRQQDHTDIEIMSETRSLLCSTGSNDATSRSEYDLYPVTLSTS